MNPLASTKCAGRLLVALAAISSILFAVGCGSSGSLTKTNPVGFGNSSLKGTYVLSISGTDVNATAETESFFAIVGAITADCNGNITGGTVDINDPDLGSPGVFLGQTVSGSYSITSDGRGSGTIKTSALTFDIDFVLSSTSSGLISRFDDAGSGSGTIDLQTSTATQASLASLAFSLSGVDSSGDAPLATVGAFTLNSSGTVTSGTEDFNDNGSGTGTAGVSLLTSSNLTLTSATNGTAQLNSNSGSFGFDVWLIDSTHMKLIETDISAAILSGDAFTQATTFPTGQVVFTMSGIDGGKSPFVAGGYATADASGDGNLTGGIEDYNDGGTGVASTQSNVAATAATSGSAPGRFQLAVTGFSNGAAQPTFNFAAYPYTSNGGNGVLLLENDSLGLAIGAAYAQTGTSINTSGGYGLNLTGVNDGVNSLSGWVEVDDIAQFAPGSPATAISSTANMTGILDENDLANQPFSTPFSGVYIPDSPATGRGSIVAPPTNGSLGTALTALNLEYYVVDSSTVLFIDVDSLADYEGEAGQIAVGTFVAQSSTSSAAASRRALSLVRPVFHPHAALRRK